MIKKIATIAISALALVGCDESTDDSANQEGQCIAERHTPSPNLPNNNKEWYDIYVSSAELPDNSTVIPSQYCLTQSGYTGGAVTFEVSKSDVLSLRYDSGTSSSGDYHKLLSSDPNNEQDDFVYDVKYSGTDAPNVDSFQLETELVGGYTYIVFETNGGVQVKVLETQVLEEVTAQYPFLTEQIAVLNAKQIYDLKADYLDF
ncbi:hypothetical protein MD535_20220 [Vibrio sp. ZSDZ65]|uniref:Lipoprotein n=1 Tax=Vibrio qingdaonensis TaxID=2829491 RepID=A0A9X3CRV5_9VIBR|nr:hypothetical protein [Vibrio qingdaonensis]MCW8348316.1 hypothetical protein [Vibrio qingdaonensis]